nr:MAG TPA: hypothetical protein [Caudoviricetes sp.]DAK42987.1 MAG TPA: hypothetical protein [Caudoviricetes sp.]
MRKATAIKLNIESTKALFPIIRSAFSLPRSRSAP